MADVRILIGDRVLIVSAYHASHVADALFDATASWKETAVEEARRVMRNGGGFDPPRAPGSTAISGFEAAADARRLAQTHERLAIAFLHAADSGNSHYRCDPATCQGARARLARMAEKQTVSA